MAVGEAGEGGWLAGEVVVIVVVVVVVVAAVAVAAVDVFGGTLRWDGTFLLIFSNASLLLAWKSGCLNVQAWSPYEARRESGWSAFLTLWKSYLLSCRTNEAKLECLNIRGRIDFVNSVISLITKLSPEGVHETIS